MRYEDMKQADDILMKYHSLFLSKIGKDVVKYVVCCIYDWRFMG